MSWCWSSHSLLAVSTLCLCLQTAETPEQPRSRVAQVDTMGQAAGAEQPAPKPPATVPFSPDLLNALTANTGNTTGRVVDQANHPEDKGLSVAGPPQADPSEPADIAGYCATLASAP